MWMNVVIQFRGKKRKTDYCLNDDRLGKRGNQPFTASKIRNAADS